MNALTKLAAKRHLTGALVESLRKKKIAAADESAYAEALKARVDNLNKVSRFEANEAARLWGPGVIKGKKIYDPPEMKLGPGGVAVGNLAGANARAAREAEAQRRREQNEAELAAASKPLVIPPSLQKMFAGNSRSPVTKASGPSEPKAPPVVAPAPQSVQSAPPMPDVPVTKQNWQGPAPKVQINQPPPQDPESFFKQEGPAITF